MRQSVFLWIGAVFIAFFAAYIQDVTSPYYPVNSVLDINGYKVSYSFDKVYRSNDSYRVWAVNNLNGLTGELLWKNKYNTRKWNTVPMKINGEVLEAYIPPHPPREKVEYKVKLDYNGKSYFIPGTDGVVMEFLGKVPRQISMFFYITLYAGILLAIRTGLEIFNDKPRLRMYALFTVMDIFAFSLLFSSVRRSAELNAIGNNVVPIEAIFSVSSMVLLGLWIAVMILVFATKKPKVWAMTGAVATLIIFFAGKFY